MRIRTVSVPRLPRIEFNWKWLFGGTVVGSVVTGYLVAAVFFFPAPFFSSERAVPGVIDLPHDEAVAALESAGLTVGDAQYENHPSYPRDQIVWQDPPEGVQVPPGTLVRLARSRGPQDIPVPDVSRYEAEIASMLITRSGLTLQRVDSIQTALPNGVAVGTRPASGATLSPGSGVILIVSRGEPTLSVPDLAGLSLEEAREELALLGLTLGRSWQEFSNAQAEGIIFRQEPPAGTLIAPGTPINVVIARTP
jgi:serine/threonine-protein kinase